MKIKRILLSLLALSMTAIASAQDSEKQGIDTVFERFKSSESFKVNFAVDTLRFTLVSSGSKFTIQGSGTMVICDGEVMYTINNETKEVIIEELSGEGLLSNPINLFTIDSSNFDVEQRGDSYVLSPVDIEEVGVEQIIVTLDSGNEVERLVLSSEDSGDTVIDIKSVSYNSDKLPDFKFDKNKYKDYEKIDFR